MNSKKTSKRQKVVYASALLGAAVVASPLITGNWMWVIDLLDSVLQILKHLSSSDPSIYTAVIPLLWMSKRKTKEQLIERVKTDVLTLRAAGYTDQQIRLLVNEITFEHCHPSYAAKVIDDIMQTIA